MEQLKGRLFLLGAFSLAGTSVVTGHILKLSLGSFTITALSLAIVLICVTPFYASKTMAIARSLSKYDWLMLVLQAVFGIFLFRAFLLYGVGLTSTVEAGILTGTTPAITAVFAYFFLREKLSVFTAIGILCTVLGIILLQGNNILATQFSSQHLFGNALILCAAASESTFNIISRSQKIKASSADAVQIQPMVQVLLVSAFAFVLSVIPAFFEQTSPVFPELGCQVCLALLWYGLMVTAVAFVFFYSGVKRCDAYTTAAFSGMMPLTSMLLSLFLLKEPVGAIEWVGGFLIVLSMVLIGQKSIKRTRTCDTNPSLLKKRLY